MNSMLTHSHVCIAQIITALCFLHRPEVNVARSRLAIIPLSDSQVIRQERRSAKAEEGTEAVHYPGLGPGKQILFFPVISKHVCIGAHISVLWRILKNTDQISLCSCISLNQNLPAMAWRCRQRFKQVILRGDSNTYYRLGNITRIVIQEKQEH